MRYHKPHLCFKSSEYIFTVPCGKGITLIFNAVSKAVGRFTNRQFKVVKKILSNPNGPASGLDDGIRIKRYLFDNGFIIPSQVSELDLLQNRNRAGIRSLQVFDLILLPTMDCNFDCFYCFENHRTGAMKPEIQKRIKKWCQKTIPKFKSLNLSWFGGEPLLCTDIIADLSDFFKTFCKLNNIGFHNIITTNGYLLSQEIVNLLKDVDLKTFNITLDGSPQWHNRFRPHKEDKKTFDKIFNGIIRTATTIPDARINIRVNYNSKNFDSISKLFDLFPVEIRKRLFLFFRQIFGEKADKCPLADKTLREKDLYAAAVQKGYQTYLGKTLIGPKETFCYADRDSSMIVNGEGEIFKCSVSNFESKDRLGKLSADGKIAWDIERVNRWKSANGFDDSCCQKCKYLPLCMGGCRAQRLGGGRSDECMQPFEHIDQLVNEVYLESCGL